MANFRKSFNFRHGVQVDEDNFVVSPGGLVGIGTTVPTKLLDVLGDVNISGILSVNQLYANSIQNIEVSSATNFSKINVGITSITSGIITASSGMITYYGDGGKLLNLPTSQWVDVNIGLGFTSIYAQGNVGVGTNDPRFLLQVGGNNLTPFVNGVGFDRNGNILATGIVTASSFSGSGQNITSLNATNISSGSLNNSRLPSSINLTGIITAGNYFSGRLVGVADTANSITTTADITVRSISSTLANVSISTVTSLLYAQEKVGIGTTNPSVDLHLRKTGSTAIQITSDGSNPARFVLGRSVSLSTNNAELRFGNTNGSLPDSTQTSLDISNYSTGNINNYLHLGSSGISTGSFNWIYGQSLNRLMTLTYTGRLGLGVTNPVNTLHVVGTSTVTGDSYIGGNLYLSGSVSPSSITVTNNSIFNGNVGIRTSNPFYPLQIGGRPFETGGGLVISRSGDVETSGVITATKFSGDGYGITNLNLGDITSDITTEGVIGAARFNGDGSTLVNLPANELFGSIDGIRDVNVTGVVTASRFAGDGSTLVNLPANELLGTIDGSVNVNTSGIVTASRFAGDGSTLTNLRGSNITSGDIDATINIAVSGIITASTGFHCGDGGPVRIRVVGNTLIFRVGALSTSFTLY